MNNLQILRANLSNLNDILKLNNKLIVFEKEKLNNILSNENFSYTLQAKQIFTYAIKNDIIYVAKINGKIIGYLYGKILYNNNLLKKLSAQIFNIYIEKEYQNFKIGTTLINEFKKYCKSKNVSYIQIMVLSNNEHAIATYRKNGFSDFANEFILEI